MKNIAVALILAAAAIAVVGLLLLRTLPGPSPAAEDPEGSIPSDAKLELALERLDRINAAVAALDAKVGVLSLAIQTIHDRPAEGEAMVDLTTSDGSNTGHTAVERKSQTIPHDLQSPQGLRNLVRQVIQEDHKERRREEERRTREHQKALEELGSGPYGKFNLRVNLMTNTLDLTESQRQRYWSLLVDSSTRIEGLRKEINMEDPDAKRILGERRRQIEEEFDGLVIQSLSPLQARDYQRLLPFERSPSPELAIESMPKIVYKALDGGSANGVVRLLPRDEGAGGPEEGPRSKGKP